MEDATCIILGLDKPLEMYAMFGVFDGHGGSAVSRRAAIELPGHIVACADQILQEKGGEGDGFVEDTLKMALPAMDETLREDGAGTPGFQPMASCGSPIPTDVVNSFALTGSTAVVALVEFDDSPKVGQPLRVIVANCGDSRALLCRGGEAVALSEDQKPECPAERDRIERAGGFVAPVGPCMRIDGWGLNLSRALGDFHYKAREDLSAHEQKVSSVPEVLTCHLSPEDEFLLLCCDGVFELKSNQEAVDYVRKGLLSGMQLTEIMEGFVDSCCSPDLVQTQGHGSDNVSAMVILLQ